MEITQLELQNKAMLVSINIKMWEGRKVDKKASREVAENNHADEKRAGRYNKHLLSDAPCLEKIKTLVGQIRQYVYKVTLPWQDDGGRILPSDLYFPFMEQMRAFDAQFRDAFAEFLCEYDSYIEANRSYLGDMHRREDYPTPEKLANKFVLTYKVWPLPCGGDFRAGLSTEEQEKQAQLIDQAVRDSVQQGIQSLWLRLHTVVKRMAERLADPDGKVYKTLVTNIQELVNILPLLNIARDPELAKLAETANQQLCQYTSEDLKKDSAMRQQTAECATALANSIAEVLDIPKLDLPEAVPAEEAAPQETYLVPTLPFVGTR